MLFRKKRSLLFLLFFALAVIGCDGRAPLPEGSVEGTEDTVLASVPAEGERQDTGSDTAAPETGESMGERKATLDLTVWLGSDLYSMDPAQAIHDLEKTLLLHQYETLLIHDQEGRLILGQAQSYEVSEDGLTFTFHLWEDLKWSDGSPLTAADLVYSWKRLADYTTASPYAADLLHAVKGYEEAAENGGRGLGVSAEDDHTFVVTLAAPCPGFLQSCAHPALSPVKEASVGAGADWSLSPKTLVGNGPMKLVSWEEGEHIRFVKNENYRDQARVTLRSITFLLTEEQGEVKEQLLREQIHLMLSDAAEPLPEAGQLIKEQAPKTGTYYLLFNQRLEPFQDARVRTALSMVLDREAIAETVMEGNVLPAYSLIGPGISGEEAGSSFYKIGQESYAPQSSLPKDRSSQTKKLDLPSAGHEGGDYPEGPDWEMARSLLAQAGYPDGDGLPVIELLTNDSGYHIALGRYLQNTWGRLGVQLKIRKITWQYFTPSRHSGDFMIARASWLMDTDDPLPFLIQFTTDHPQNDSHYSNSQVDAAIEAAKEAMDRRSYHQSLHKAEQLILEDGAAIPIAFYQDTWLQAKDLDGIWHMPDGTWKFMYSTISHR